MSEKVTKRLFVYDEKTDKYFKGYHKDIARLPDVIELKWTNCTTTNAKPDGGDVDIDVEEAEVIAVQADSTDPNNSGTSIDVNVLASLDGNVWDTTPYAEMNMGDAEIKTMLVTAGVKKIRIRLDYNSGGTRADVRVLVKVRE